MNESIPDRIHLDGVFKFLVEFTPRDMNNPNIMITHAQGLFLNRFGYSLDDTPIQLEQLFPPISRRTFRELERALLRCRPYTNCIDLVTATGALCLVHLAMIVEAGREGELSARNNEMKNGDIKIISAEDSLESTQGPLRVAVITVRSARRVGNNVEIDDDSLGLNTNNTKTLFQVLDEMKESTDEGKDISDVV